LIVVASSGFGGLGACLAACVSPATAGYTAATANIIALNLDACAPESIASVYGLASMGSGFGSMVFALLPMLCVFVLWYVMGPIEGHRSGSWPLAPPQA
jgi:hypothetical protein